MPDEQEPRWMVFLRRWGSWVAIGAVLLLVGAFLELSGEVFSRSEPVGPLLSVDRDVLLFQLRIRSAWLNGPAVDLSALGSPLVLALFVLVMGTILLSTGDRRGTAVLVLGSLGSAPLALGMKALLERSRPHVIPRLVEVSGFSYPSGHSLGSAAVYLTAAFVMAGRVPRWGQRVCIVGFAAAIVTLIGASRIYLGVHYPSDVVAGTLVGASLAIVMGVVVRRHLPVPERPET